MKKKLHLLFLLPALLVGCLFTSCEGDKYYYEDPSYSWENHYIEIANKDWKWNSSLKRYEYIYDFSSNNINADEFIYYKGGILPYLLLGTKDKGETKHLITQNTYLESQQGFFGCDISMSRNNKNAFTALFYFYWSDPNDTTPAPLYKYDLYLFWGKE